MNDQRLAEAVFRVEGMGQDISEIKGAIKDLAIAVGRLAVIEDRQSQDREAIGRAHNRLDIHDGRIKTLEIAQPMSEQTTTWVHKAAVVIVTAVLSVMVYRTIAGPGAPMHIEAPGGVTIGGKP